MFLKTNDYIQISQILFLKIKHGRYLIKISFLPPLCKSILDAFVLVGCSSSTFLEDLTFFFPQMKFIVLDNKTRFSFPLLYDFSFQPSLERTNALV